MLQQRDNAAQGTQHLGVQAQNTEPNKLVVVYDALGRSGCKLLVQYTLVQSCDVLRRI